jgi:hypothetical protein
MVERREHESSGTGRRDAEGPNEAEGDEGRRRGHQGWSG